MIAQCEKCGTIYPDPELHGCHCHCGGVIYLRNAVKAPTVQHDCGSCYGLRKELAAAQAEIVTLRTSLAAAMPYVPFIPGDSPTKKISPVLERTAADYAGNTVVDSAELAELKNDRHRFEFLMFVMSRPDSIVNRDSVDAAIAERNEPTRAAAQTSSPEASP